MAFWSHRLIVGLHIESFGVSSFGGLRRSLSDNQLTGMLPTELGAMTAMIYL
jgi:hypothetical protein